MLEFQLDQIPSSGQLTARLAHGRTQVDCQFDFAAGTMSVTFNASPHIEAAIPLPRSLSSGSHLIMVSGLSMASWWSGLTNSRSANRSCFPSARKSLPPRGSTRSPHWGTGSCNQRRAISACIAMSITPRRTTPKARSLRSADDEYFALGDNSPVSVDSRCWESPGVPERSLIGKPFVVHLPSRPGRIALGGKVTYVRVPDFSRVRYIR